MSIEPYTKNKSMRDAIELAAEEFCSIKRASLAPTQPVKQPDYIFTTDGCSGWPDGSWLACCVVHDMAYWCGGSAQDRKQADRELEQCVNSKVKSMGSLMYAGVRIGGHPWLPTPWRWGYGWDNWPEGYEKSTASLSIENLIEKLNIQQMIEQHLLNVK